MRRKKRIHPLEFEALLRSSGHLVDVIGWGHGQGCVQDDRAAAQKHAHVALLFVVRRVPGAGAVQKFDRN
jgi:hypothetical protein